MKIQQFFEPGGMNIFRILKMERKFLLLIFVQFMFIFPLFSQNNQQNISGLITDDKGETMVGVNIIIKNTLIGTVTDIDGRYNINAGANDTLQVSFIGYKIEFIPINGRTEINVQLKSDATDLDEIIVVGYGEVKRANLLGSISSISAAEIEDIPATNLSTLLEGRMAGVSVSPAQPTGNPGASTRITIRGETTFGLAGGTFKDPSPLYIVDGFEVSQEEYDVLDPSEIESFSVLKDASAAVYGSKGANGVLLIKTKRGREGKMRISYSGSYGISDATMQTEMLSAYDHARMLNSKYIDDPEFIQISNEELEAMKGQNHNWLSEAWQKSMVTRHTINISGGSDRVKYFAGGSYNYTEGNFPDMGVGKYSYRLGLDAKIVKGLSASITVALDSRDFKRPYISGAGVNTMEGMFKTLLQAPKWTPPFIDGMPVYNNVESNPFALFQSDSYRRDVDKGNTLNAKLTYEFEKVKGLTASVSYSRREGHSYNKEYNIPYQLYEFQQETGYKYILSNQMIEIHENTNKNRISESFGSNQNYQFNFNLNYNKKIGKHDFAAFATYEQSEGSSYGFGAVAENMLIYGIETQRAFDYLSAVSNGSMNESGDLGAVARLNYSYADKYLIESTLRYESTVKFAPGERDGFFPAVSVGWVMSEENFIKDNLSFVNFMKIRFSMGLTGYSSVGGYEYNLSYNPSGSYLFGSGTAAGGMGVAGKTDVVSSGVSWEKSRMHNLGVDLKLFNSRLSISPDVFYTYQFDILDKRTVEFPQTSGITEMPSENLGRLEAWGYDMSIGYHGGIGKDFSWNASGIFSFSTNRILERPTQYESNDFRYPIGQSTNAAGREEGYYSNGMIRTQAQLDQINAEWMEKWGHIYTIEGKPAELGTLFFQDIGRPGNPNIGEPETVFEPDGEIHIVHDKTYVERINDHFVWQNLLPTNISLSAKWKNISVSTMFGMRYGITNYVVDKLARTGPTETESSPAFWSDYWSLDNTDAAYPNPKLSSHNQWVSTFWMKDVYQLRMKNLNISYSIPKELSTKWGIPDVRVYFVGTNLWSPITTFDYKEDAIARYNTYPLMRTFSFGLNLKL